MEKRVWENPLTMVQQFVPNEYVAACGDSGTTYLFTCDAGGGRIGSVYLETNGRPGLQTGRSSIPSSFPQRASWARGMRRGSPGPAP